MLPAVYGHCTPRQYRITTDHLKGVGREYHPSLSTTNGTNALLQLSMKSVVERTDPRDQFDQCKGTNLKHFRGLTSCEERAIGRPIIKCLLAKYSCVASFRLRSMP